MKNPHGVEPTRFKKRENNEYGIFCCSQYGPIFGFLEGDIYIHSQCNRENVCYINNNGECGYECHPQYKTSLFVDTADPDEVNRFTLLDYEVFGIDYKNRENINKLCKYPDMMMEYIETNDISEESLKQFDDDIGLLSDLDAIHCNDSDIRVKISQYFLKNPSELLVNTQIINRQYDSYLKEWVGDHKWKLLYRASEHRYTARSFHVCCNNIKSSTLIVIKSSGGWIFGAYTTQSWTGFFTGCIYYNTI